MCLYVKWQQLRSGAALFSSLVPFAAPSWVSGRWPGPRAFLKWNNCVKYGAGPNGLRGQSFQPWLYCFYMPLLPRETQGSFYRGTCSKGHWTVLSHGHMTVCWWLECWSIGGERGFSLVMDVPRAKLQFYSLLPWASFSSSVIRRL